MAVPGFVFCDLQRAFHLSFAAPSWTVRFPRGFNIPGDSFLSLFSSVQGCAHLNHGTQKENVIHFPAIAYPAIIKAILQAPLNLFNR